MVSFLIGCSFSFESALLDADIPVRQIEEGVNVPMYNTNIPCASAGVFSGNMVVSMDISARVVTPDVPKAGDSSLPVGAALAAMAAAAGLLVVTRRRSVAA